MGDDQHGAFVTVNELCQAVQVAEVQEYIRFIQNQQVGSQQHFTHNLQDLILTAADLRQLSFRQMGHSCHIKLLVYFIFIIVPVHGLVQIQQSLVTGEDFFHIFSGCHFLTNLRDLLLGFQETLTEKLKHSPFLIFVSDCKLAGITNAAFLRFCDFTVVETLVRVDNHVHQRGFAGAVAANQCTMLPSLQGERNVFI